MPARNGSAGATVWLGALSQMSAEHFREHFDAEVRGTVAEGAALTHRSVGRSRRARRAIRCVAIRRTGGLSPDEPRPDDRGGRRPVTRLRLDLTGAIQGVGFRPVYPPPRQHRTTGRFRAQHRRWRIDRGRGRAQALERFLARLDKEMPPRAAVFKRRTARSARAATAALSSRRARMPARGRRS